MYFLRNKITKNCWVVMEHRPDPGVLWGVLFSLLSVLSPYSDILLKSLLKSCWIITNVIYHKCYIQFVIKVEH